MTGVFNINRRRFALSGGIGFTALLVVVVTLMMTGAIFASLPLAGVGGFQVNATGITGSNFELITNFADNGLGSTTVTGPTKDDKNHNGYDVYPMAQIFMDTVNISGLVLTKYLDTRPFQAMGLPANIDYVIVNIEASGTASGSGLTMNATRVEATAITLNDMEMDENMEVGHLTEALASGNPTIDTNDQVPAGMKASSVNITDAHINGHYMKLSSITINGMTLYVKLYDESDVQVDPAVEDAPNAEPWPVFSNM